MATFTVDDGLISHIDLALTSAYTLYLDRDQIDQYEHWVEVNHPADHSDLFSFGTMMLEPRERLERHHQLIAEWAEQVG